MWTQLGLAPPYTVCKPVTEMQATSPGSMPKHSYSKIDRISLQSFVLQVTSPLVEVACAVANLKWPCSRLRAM